MELEASEKRRPWATVAVVLRVEAEAVEDVLETINGLPGSRLVYKSGEPAQVAHR